MIIPAVMQIHTYRRLVGPPLGLHGRWRLRWTVESAEHLGYVGEGWTAAVDAVDRSATGVPLVADIGVGRILCAKAPETDAAGREVLTGTVVIVDGPMAVREGQRRDVIDPASENAFVTATVTGLRLASMPYDYVVESGDPIEFDGRVGQWFDLAPVRGSQLVTRIDGPPSELRHGDLKGDGVMWQEMLVVDLDTED
ncbi:hypothetical protein [Tsukamurella pulmonis]|uniref:hypothetical protein n=1 Tax=Tsukamurella pulmonis TaxID=47312 RepID=UPI001EDF6BB3|nr:hypothetical protein [Tsukamurella pulmonis]